MQPARYAPLSYEKFPTFTKKKNVTVTLYRKHELLLVLQRGAQPNALHPSQHEAAAMRQGPILAPPHTSRSNPSTR